MEHDEQAILKRIRSKKKTNQDSFLEVLDKKKIDEFELEEALT